MAAALLCGALVVSAYLGGGARTRGPSPGMRHFASSRSAAHLVFASQAAEDDEHDGNHEEEATDDDVRRSSSSEQEGLLSAEDMEESWRAFRHRLVTDGDRVPTPNAAADDETRGWVHRIPHFERGCVLLPRPDVAFEKSTLLERSVLLLLEHSEDGSLAIALNRPTDKQLRDVLGGEKEELGRAFGDRPLHLGGVSSDAAGGASNVWMLAMTEGGSRREHAEFAGDGQAEPVLPGLWLASSGGAAQSVLNGRAPADRFHFFAGAYVWAAGELEAEFEAGAWLAAAASAPALAAHLLGNGGTPEGKYLTALEWLDEEDSEMGFLGEDGDGIDLFSFDDSIGGGDGGGGGGVFVDGEMIITSGGVDEVSGDDDDTIFTLGSDNVDLSSLGRAGGLSGLADGSEGIDGARPAGGSGSGGGGSWSGRTDARLRQAREVLQCVHGWVALFSEEKAAAEGEGGVGGGTSLAVPTLSALLGTAHSWLPSHIEGSERAAAGSAKEGEEAVEAAEAMRWAAEKLEAPLVRLASKVEELMNPTGATRAGSDGRATSAGPTWAGARWLDTLFAMGNSPREIFPEDTNVEEGGGEEEEEGALDGPRFALQAIRKALLEFAGASVIPDEQPAVELQNLDFGGRVEALAARLNQGVQLYPEGGAEGVAEDVAGVAAGTARAAEAAPDCADGNGKVDLSSLQLGLVTLLLAEQVGLTARLVDVEGCGLLLRAEMGSAEEPLYVSLAPGESCLRTLSQEDCLGPALQLAMREDVTAEELADLELELDPLCLASLLAEEWSEAFRVAQKPRSAKFWDVQRHVLQRLSEKVAEARGETEGSALRRARRRAGGHSESKHRAADFRGLVVRMQREDDGELFLP
jgi:putative AlgH/UPF0301 family transcriptional regulator